MTLLPNVWKGLKTNTIATCITLTRVIWWMKDYDWSSDRVSTGVKGVVSMVNVYLVVVCGLSGRVTGGCCCGSTFSGSCVEWWSKESSSSVLFIFTGSGAGVSAGLHGFTMFKGFISLMVCWWCRQLPSSSLRTKFLSTQENYISNIIKTL